MLRRSDSLPLTVPHPFYCILHRAVPAGFGWLRTGATAQAPFRAVLEDGARSQCTHPSCPRGRQPPRGETPRSGAALVLAPLAGSPRALHFPINSPPPPLSREAKPGHLRHAHWIKIIHVCSCARRHVSYLKSRAGNGKSSPCFPAPRPPSPRCAGARGARAPCRPAGARGGFRALGALLSLELLCWFPPEAALRLQVTPRSPGASPSRSPELLHLQRWMRLP